MLAMEAHLEFAKNLAYKAGELILGNFGKEQAIETKADNSPVTAVDKRINRMIMKAVRSEYPGFGLLAEEGDLGNGQEEFQWVCDPLDGTSAFIAGIPHSMFILGLSRQGTMAISVAYDPFGGKLYHAILGQGAYCNGQSIHVNHDDLHNGTACLESSAQGHWEKEIALAGGKVEKPRGTGYKCMMVATGGYVGMIKPNADLHDIGPASLIIEEAGGKVTSFDGNPISYGKKCMGNLVLSNGMIHGKLLEIANRALKNA